jgi:hypothetical protein
MAKVNPGPANVGSANLTGIQEVGGSQVGRAIDPQYGIAAWSDSTGTALVKPNGSTISLGASGGLYIYAGDYAIDPTGVADSAPALNQAIQDAITARKKLVIPSGVFLLNSPLLCYTANYSKTLQCVIIEGQGDLANNTATFPLPPDQYKSNTILYANFTTLPAIIYNLNRDCELRNLSIVGKNVAPYSASNPVSPNRSNYITGGCRDSQFSPYCGIAIDPFCANTPADSGYAGFTYGTNVGSGSHGLLIENVSIWGFVVGVMASPSIGAAQGDCVYFSNCDIHICATAVAIGQLQSKNNIFEGCNIGWCHTGIDGLSYGAGTGSPTKISHTQFGNIYQAIKLPGAYSPAIFDACYFEAIETLGYVSPSGFYPIVFQACEVHFKSTGGWLLNPIVLQAGGPVIFTGCSFQDNDQASYAYNFINYYGIKTKFVGCYFKGTGTAGVIPHIGYCLSATAGGFPELDGCYIDGGQFGGMITTINQNTSRSSSIGTFNGGITGRYTATFQSCRVTGLQNEYMYIPPSGYQPEGGISVTSLTLNANTVTFSKVNAGFYFQPGDRIIWTMVAQFGSGVKFTVPALIIPAGGISGNNVTCNMLFDPAQYDTVGNQTYAAGFVGVIPNYWAPDQALTCTTNSSTTLTAVSPVTTIVAGDFLIGTGANAADIPAGCRVVSTNGAGTVVISQAATGSHAGVGLCFGRLNLVGLTPQW